MNGIIMTAGTPRRTDAEAARVVTLRQDWQA